jgi:hypothetical protein
MKKNLMLIVSLACALALSAAAQKKYKPWAEWTEKDATKMLNDSPWGKTQTETNTSEMFFSPTTQSGATGAANSGGTGGGIGGVNNRNAQGATNQSVNVNFRIRLLSARPIR